MQYNTTMNAAECIKILLLKEAMTITKLASLMPERNGRKLTRAGLSNKLYANTLRFDELMSICDILGYELDFKKKKL